MEISKHHGDLFSLSGGTNSMISWWKDNVQVFFEPQFHIQLFNSSWISLMTIARLSHHL